MKSSLTENQKTVEAGSLIYPSIYKSIIKNTKNPLESAKSTFYSIRNLHSEIRNYVHPRPISNKNLKVVTL
jgi:hypothetical protein